MAMEARVAKLESEIQSLRIGNALLKQRLENHEIRLNQLEKDRQTALKSGFLAVGSALVAVLIYIWQGHIKHG